MDIFEILATIGTDSPVSDADLEAARAEAVELLQAALPEEGERDLEAGRELSEAIKTIDAELAARTEAREAEAAEARALLEAVVGVEAEEEEEEVVEAEEVQEPVAVAASLQPSTVARLRSRIIAAEEDENPTNVTFSGQGAASNVRFDSRSTLFDVADIFSRHARGKQQGILVHADFDYPEDRILGGNADENTRLMHAVEEQIRANGLGAAGGICAPLEADFTHPVIGDRERPVRNALVRFGADRGGVRYAPIVTLGDVANGVGTWSIDTDESPGETTKNLLVLDCEDELEAKVDAVTAWLQIGNFQAKFNPEFWRSRLEALAIAHDRHAEQKLLTEIAAGSTAVTTSSTDGTIYNVLASIDKMVAGMRSRLRYRGGIDVILPEWVHQAIRADITKQRLGGNPAMLSTADNMIDSFFSTRGVNPIYSLDYQPLAAQNSGAMVDFPSGELDYLIYPTGTWAFLDGGTLDLGTEIVDSELIGQNNRQAFYETFEKAAKRGTQSFQVTVDVAESCKCPEELVLPESE